MSFGSALEFGPIFFEFTPKAGLRGTLGLHGKADNASSPVLLHTHEHTFCIASVAMAYRKGVHVRHPSRQTRI